VPAQFDALVTGAGSRNDQRAVELGACGELAPPAGSKLAFHVYAKGVQIYRWSGSSWSFVGPSALMSADAGGRSVVGTHYAGPTWESVSGGKLVAAALKPCTPDANAIPWLLLGVVSNEGPGVFQRVTHIQRVNTVGGKAPSNPGSVTGQEARQPYSAEYLFFRAP
jgi:hypothetical protein